MSCRANREKAGPPAMIRLSGARALIRAPAVFREER